MLIPASWISHLFIFMDCQRNRFISKSSSDLRSFFFSLMVLPVGVIWFVITTIKNKVCMCCAKQIFRLCNSSQLVGVYWTCQIRVGFRVTIRELQLILETCFGWQEYFFLIICVADSFLQSNLLSCSTQVIFGLYINLLKIGRMRQKYLDFWPDNPVFLPYPHNHSSSDFYFYF